MAVSNYATLISAVTEAAEDESAEFASFLPTIVGFAETRIKREIDTNGLTRTATVTVSASTETFDKPSDYKFPYSLTFTTSDGRVKSVVKENETYLQQYWPNETSVDGAGPRYYADVNRSVMKIAPCFASATPVVLKYQADIAPLTSSNSTNYLTSVASDIFFYACMAEAARFKKHWEEIAYWDNMYISSLTALNNEGRRARDDDSDTPYKYGDNTLAKEEK